MALARAIEGDRLYVGPECPAYEGQDDVHFLERPWWLFLRSSTLDRGRDDLFELVVPRMRSNGNAE